MELYSIFIIAGFLIWIISILFYFRSVILDSDSIIVISCYNLFAYFIYTLECILKIIYSEDYSSISLYIFLLFAVINLYISSYITLDSITRHYFIRLFTKLNQILLIIV